MGEDRWLLQDAPRRTEVSEARAWETSTQPERMLAMLPSATERKRRLLLVACCRACMPRLSDDLRHVIWVGELAADELAASWELRQAHELATREIRSAEFGRELASDDPDEYLDRQQVFELATAACAILLPTDTHSFRGAVRLPSPDIAAELLREIFGNPFRSVAFDPAWGTDTALSLAKHIYESRDFSAMPILADALQDAGCDNDDILTHCRGNGPHVRGCWVLDLVLGKS